MKFICYYSDYLRVSLCSPCFCGYFLPRRHRGHGVTQRNINPPAKVKPKRWQAGKFLSTQTVTFIFKINLLVFLFSTSYLNSSALSFYPPPSYQIALLKYNGGGDWYANLETSLPNLIKYCNDNLKTNINPEQAIVEAGSIEIFNYPLVHVTGHGNIIFSTQEADNLRNYLMGGGFLHISDNYGMDKFIRTQIKKIFPELDFVELPFTHPIYHQKYDFDKGLPKIHEHDNKPPQGFGLIYNGRLVCFYDVECDLGDGWENYEVHKDSPEAHERALKMGANIISYAFTSDN